MLSVKNKRQTNILPFFPGSLPDETIGSRAVRYHIRRANSSTTQTYKELFGKLPFPLTYTVQPNLDKLAERMPGNAVENQIQLEQQNTLMPLFRLFNGTSAASHSSAISEQVSATTSRRVVGATHYTNLCPDCLIQDEQEHGLPYLHRSHQIPGVTACWRHRRVLLDCCPSCSCPFSAKNELITTAWHGCTSCGKTTIDLAKQKYPEPSKTEIEFAIFAKDLLHFNELKLSNHLVFKMYIQRAQELGLGWGRDRINRTKLQVRAGKLFGTALLAKMDPAFKAGKLSGWFRALESSSIEAPLHRHLIVSYMLFRNIAQFSKCAKKIVGAQAKDTNASQPPSAPTIDKKLDEINQIEGELIQTAVRYEYDIEKLWRYKFSTMQRLVKLHPDAINNLEKKLKKKANKAIFPKRDDATRKEADAEADIKWRDSILEAAKRLYAVEKRPIRISVNRVIEAAEFSPKGCHHPIESRFPLARAAAIASGESIWHFYARRMLWTLQALPDLDSPPRLIRQLSGLELYKGLAILEYFESHPRGGGPSIAGINTILEKHGIPRNWTGPCPERSFYAAGRAYRLRTNRRGNVGDKASDRRQVTSGGASSI